MNQVEKDDFSYALGQTLEFYGKELDKTQFSFWYQAMQDKPVHKIKAALLEYVKIGRFAPRPAQILELIGTTTEQSRRELPPPEPDSNPCPPEIHAAWTWFISMYTKGSNLEGLFRGEPITIEEETKYLNIVNHEARRLNLPEAIPEEFRLAEVWG